jgi:ribose transport system ATP-binding protein
VGEEMGDTTLQAPSPIEADAPVILQAMGLCGGPLRDIDLELRAGEILGIAGLVGSGRTSLLQQLFGVHRPTAGAIRYEGREVTIKSPADAIKLGMAMIPEERRSEGLLLLRSVRENAVLAHLSRFRWDRRLGIPSRRKEREATEGQIKALSIRTSGSEQRVSELSGGNQQKVLVARWLLGSGLKVLILDEPTKGVDVGAKAEIFGIVRQLAMGGVGVLLVSSDLEEVAEVCHRAVVLVEGRLGGEVVSPFSESDILAVCYEGARA